MVGSMRTLHLAFRGLERARGGCATQRYASAWDPFCSDPLPCEPVEVGHHELKLASFVALIEIASNAIEIWEEGVFVGATGFEVRRQRLPRLSFYPYFYLCNSRYSFLQCFR